MNPRYFCLHASREREVTSVGVSRRCDYARAAAAWLLAAFACLAVPIPALAAEAAVHQKFEAPYRALAAAESAPPIWTATPAVRENPDTSLDDDDDDDDDDDAIGIHSEWKPSPLRRLIALRISIASPVILTGGCSLRGPPATTSFTS